MSQAKEKAAYTHGHHSSVVNHHARRGAADSAAFLIPHIKPNSKILDVGCGPGSISVDFAALVPEGHITGVDFVASVIDQAKQHAASKGVSNIDFQHQDANALPFPDNSFDIVTCHQVLQHVGSPVDILSEMRRVAKPGGIVAARESDYAAFAWYPELPLIARWQSLYIAVARANGGEPNAGRYMHVWAREAGFKPEDVEVSWDCWRYVGEQAEHFAGSNTGRVLQPGFMGTAVREGLATEEEVKQISKAWNEWGGQADACIVIPCGQILCRKR